MDVAINHTPLGELSRSNPMQVCVSLDNNTVMYFSRSATVGELMMYCALNKVSITGVTR